MTIVLRNGSLEVTIEPERGGEIAQVRAHGIPLLFAWEPRALEGDDSATRWLRRYRGGWQTIFPNGGEESEGCGFHGSASSAPFAASAAGDTVEMRAAVDGFEIARTVRVTGDAVDVLERITSRAADAREVMWSHHPAFGAPFLSPSCTVECDARAFVADAERDVPLGDLLPGARSDWPRAAGRDGSAVDLSRLPDRCDRFGYLVECTRAAIVNPDLGLRAELSWDGFAHAWYWLEARATAGAPWFGDAYVFGLEPAACYPGHGIASVRRAGNALVRFEPDETKEARVRLNVART